MNEILKEKLVHLRRRIHELGSAVVAFSGGVDSSVLVYLAGEELKGRMIAVTAISPSYPSGDRDTAFKFCENLRIPHKSIETAEFSDPVFVSNPPDRCYHCKKHLYRTLVDIADKKGFNFVIEGTNIEDLSGHRPGFEASKENPRVVTPLIDEKFTKKDVRDAAKSFGLEVWAKPSAACLASRVPAGVHLTLELMERIDAAENIIRAAGVGQVRVRHHNELARIEVESKDIGIVIEHRARLLDELKKLGWKFVTIDLCGYRTGGMMSS